MSIVDKGFEPINTRDEIAKDLGWSTGKKIGRPLTEPTPETIPIDGKVSYQLGIFYIIREILLNHFRMFGIL